LKIVRKLLQQLATALTTLFATQSPRSLAILLSLWILGLGALAFLWQLGSVGLVDETEPLFAEAARQMLVRQDWVTPYFNDLTRFDKPPLIYWLMAIVYGILGVNEWAVRLPSALAAIGLMAGLGYTLVSYGYLPDRSSPPAPDQPRPQGWYSAFLATAMTAFCGEMLAWGRVGVSDMLLNGCIGSCLLCFFQGYACPSPKLPQNWTRALWEIPAPSQWRGQWGWYFAAYTFAALGILTKGPVGLVLPGLIVLVFLAWTGQWSVLGELRLGLGFLWITLLAVPWFILVIQANGEAYINSFFGYHNLERFTQVVNYHSAPWYFYFVVVAVGFAPWAIYLLPAFHRLRFWQWRRWRSLPRHSHLGLFAACWFGVIFTFFTIAATKLPSYVLPLMPAAAILVALDWVDRFTTGDRSRDLSGNDQEGVPRPQRNIPLFPLLNVGFLSLLGLAFLLQSRWLPAIQDPSMPNFATDLERSGVLPIAGVISLVAAIVCLTLILTQQTPWIWSSNLIAFLLIFIFTLLPAIFTLDQHRQKPLRELAAVLTQVRQPEEPIMMLGLEKPSLVFYSHQSMHFFRTADPARTFFQQMVTEGTHPTLLLITYPRRFPDLGLREDRIEILSKNGVYALARVPIR
jgi:4-amino-4-deoxy-L-arabinose transferase-like glycosyltransferase